MWWWDLAGEGVVGCGRLRCQKIVDMLNDMYERFDNATTRWDVYKVTCCLIVAVVVGGGGG